MCVCDRSGQYSGGEDARLAVLGLACDLGAPYVDVELKAAAAFSAARGAPTNLYHTREWRAVRAMHACMRAQVQV